MAEIINLRRARKARARTEAGRTAEANRALFGEATPLRKARAAEEARRLQALEGARLEKDEG
ncbi:MAG TPA: DUF4169 family protein [Novosphingobium sp.]|nr:DUF4169 family protein [Novosphingobium sp.]HZV10194.1 DUF4169 family protein [Novosphingobium sp.]